MARGSLHLSMFVQGDHLYDERGTVRADPGRFSSKASVT
jgi:hypothetical protein